MAAPVRFFLGAVSVDGYLYQLLLKKPNNLHMDINCATEEIPNIINDKVIEMLIITSIETMKRQKSKCGKDDLFKLVKDTIEENMTRNIFDKTLDSLIECGSVKCNLISSITCPSLRKPRN